MEGKDVEWEDEVCQVTIWIWERNIVYTVVFVWDTVHCHCKKVAPTPTPKSLSKRDRGLEAVGPKTLSCSVYTLWTAITFPL